MHRRQERVRACGKDQLVERNILSALNFELPLPDGDNFGSGQKTDLSVVVPRRRVDGQLRVADIAGEVAGQIDAVVGKSRLARDHRDLCIGRSPARGLDCGDRRDAAADHDDARRRAGRRRRGRRFLDGLEAFGTRAAKRALARRFGAVMLIPAHRAAPARNRRFCRRGRGWFAERFEVRGGRSADGTKIGRRIAVVDIAADDATP